MAFTRHHASSKFTGERTLPALDRASGQRVSEHPVDRLYLGLSATTRPERTERLMTASIQKKSRKLIEEATEVAIDAIEGHKDGVVRESADLLYHLVVIWRSLEIEPADVWAEMARCTAAYGLAEKRAKVGDGLDHADEQRPWRNRDFGPIYLRPSRGNPQQD